MPVKVSDLFFDKQLIIDLIGKEKAKQLSESGAHIKRSAQESMHYTVKKPS